MITLINVNQFNNTLELYGLSTDEKPIDKFNNYKITNASTLYCMDSQTVYLFDETNTKWIEQ